MHRIIILVLSLLWATATLSAETYTKNVAIVVFEGVEVLDLAAPAEIFAVAARYGASGQEPAFRVYTVGTSRAPVASQGFLDVTPDYAVDDAPKPDILVLPGGRAEHASNDPKLMAWIRSVAPGAEHVLTICYGSFIAGRAGLVDGLEITTWYGSVEQLGEEFPKARAVPGRRFIDNGKLITTAGVSAGLDGSLHLVARTLGRYVADRTAEYMEYPWAPQSPASASYAQLNPRLDGRGRKLQQAAIAVRDRDYDTAVAVHRELLAVNTEDAEAWLQLGNTLYAAKRYGEAIAPFTHAARDEARRGRALYSLAGVYALDGQPAKAVDHVARAIEAGIRTKRLYLRDPDFASIRNDPRFQELLSKL
jgi:transcriptional regulator GlxA family with amidase domain